MRGEIDHQGNFLTVVNIEKRVPAEHPIRSIKRNVDRILKQWSPLFDELYSKNGRPSIPPEQLLKSRILMALYSVRSERSFCEQLDYNLLWMWFLDRRVEEGGFDHSVFSHNYQRLLCQEVAEMFFVEVYELSREGGWTSDEHFSADGSLIEAWASLKSFRPRDDDDEDSNSNAGNGWKPSNPEVDFRGKKRSNATHQSRTDPEAVLYRKGRGKEAKLCFGMHAIMENRNGLLAAIDVHNPIEQTESKMAVKQLDRLSSSGQAKPSTVGGDKNYHNKEFVRECRKRGIVPHVACVKGRKTPGLDGRTIGRAAYDVSQRVRKRIEEIFGWGKDIANLRKSRQKGEERSGAMVKFGGAAYNLVRLAKLEASCEA